MGYEVKPGREYVLGGRVYKSGDAVEGVPQKFIPILTAPKGPLQESAKIKSASDLPIEVMERAPVAPAEETKESDPNESAGRYYRRRDLVVENGQIGEDSRLRSSRRGRPPKQRT